MTPVESTVEGSSCCRLLKEFEREARADGMPVPMLQDRKKVLADQLNTYIQQRKEIGVGAQKDELFAGGIQPQEETIERKCMPVASMHPPAVAEATTFFAAEMSMQQLMQRGRRDWEDTEVTLARAERLVEDTEQIGVQVGTHNICWCCGLTQPNMICK